MRGVGSLIIICFCWFLFFCNISISYGGNNDSNIHKLEEIIVTSTSDTKLINMPASTSVITADDLEEMGAKSIAEAIKRVPGIIDKSSSKDNLDIRGTQLGMSGGPVIMIDGVPQKIGSSRYDYFNFIPVSQVERIEVLRSPGIVYGPGAARGVINIITKKGTREKPFNFDISGAYGSWETYDSSVNFYGGIDKWDYFLNATDYMTKGYEDEEENRDAVLVKAGYNFSNGTRLGIRANFITNEKENSYGLRKKKWHLHDFRDEKHFPKSKTDTTLYWHNEREQEETIFGVDFSQREKWFFLNSSVSWTGFSEEYNSMYEKFTSPKKVYRDDRDQDTLVFTLSGGPKIGSDAFIYTPSFGINIEDLRFEQRRSYPNNLTKSTDKYDLDIDERLYGFFWDNDILLWDTIALKIGSRVDQTDIAFKNNVPTKVHEKETLIGWVISPSYHFSEKGNVFFSLSRTFWSPTPQYYAWAAEKGGVENRPEDLKAERSLTYELGYRHLIHRTCNISLTGFHTNYKDKFLGYYDSSGTWLGYKNVGETVHQGVELEGDGRIFSWFGYRISGTWLKVEWREGKMKVREHPSNTSGVKNLRGYDLYGVPDYTYSAGCDFYPLKGLKCNFDVNGTGPYYVDALNRIEYGERTTIDAGISYKFKGVKLWILGKNILDKEMERAINSTGKLLAGEYDNSYYVRNGRYVEAGLSYSF